MKKSLLGKILAVFLSAFLILSTVGCGSDKDENKNLPALTVWVFSDEYKSEIERAFLGDFTSVSWRLNVVVVESSELSEKLSEAQASGVGTPDVFMLSPDMLCRYNESDITADLGELGFSLSDSSYYPYTIDAGINENGILKAVCYQPDPGMFFYRRSMAKVYLGTDDPDEVQEKISNWDRFLETAKSIHSASGGDTCMTVGFDGIMMAYMAEDEDGWITSEGKFSVSDKAVDFMQYAASLSEAGVVYDAEQWSNAWTVGISDTESVFGYFSSGLGMKNILKKACGGTVDGEGSYGDWGCVIGPSAYNWGGCWFAVRHGSDMTEQAVSFLRYFICEEEAMRKNSLVSGFFCPNRTVVDSVKFDTQFSDAFLSGQNYYSVMSQAAGDVSIGNPSRYDSIINLAFADCVRDFAFGRKSQEQAIFDLTKTVYEAYPELI